MVSYVFVDKTLVPLQKLCLMEQKSVNPEDELMNLLNDREKQMNKVFITRLDDKVSAAKPSGYQLQLMENLTEKRIQQLDLKVSFFLCWHP